MSDMLRLLYRSAVDLFNDTCAMTCGVFTAVIGYFLPVSNIVHVLIAFFILDILLGWWKSWKLKRERFSTSKIWETTIPRMGLSLVLIMCAFMWDKTYNQEFVCTYKLIGWFISGVVLYSVMVNMYLITNWGVFKAIVELVRSILKSKTGYDAENETQSKTPVGNNENHGSE